MKKSLTVILAIIALMSFGMAQGAWTFQEILVDFEDTLNAPMAGNYTSGYPLNGMHGVVVAPDGNVWIAIHSGYGNEFIGYNHSAGVADTVCHYKPLWVIDPVTKDHVSFSPINQLTFPDASIDTLYAESIQNGSGKGIALDNDGNILYSSFSTLYRINYQTGEGMNKFTPWDDMSSATEATQDDAGNIYFGYVLGATRPVYILDNDFNLLGNAVDALGHITRSLEISDDGKDLYVGSTWNGFGVEHWHDNSVIPGVTDFQVADTFAVFSDVPAKWAYVGSAVGDSAYIACDPSEADTIIAHVPLWSSSLDFDETGILWVGALTAIWGGPMGGKWYGFDPATGDLLDESGVQHGDRLQGGTDGPRGASWSDRNHMYLAEFYANTVSIFYNPNPIGLEIDDDSDQPIIAEGYTLGQNYPNPFNPGTTIEFVLPQKELINLSIFNMQGQLVRTLAIGQYNSGKHVVHWNGRNAAGEKVASGTYLYRLTSKDVTFTKQMVLLK